MLNVGLIGCGGIMGGHVEGWKKITDRAHVVAVADISEEAAQRRAEQLGYQVAIYEDYRLLLADESIDLVDIGLPHHLHCDAIVAAAEAGKHVMTEKPLCLNLDEATKIAQAVEANGVTLMAAHNQLFFPAVQRAKQMLLDGALGKVYMIRSYDCSARMTQLNPDKAKWGVAESVFRDTWRSDPEKMGGGELIDTGYHPTYRLLFLAGQQPYQVVSMMGTHRLPLKEEDTADVLVKFKNGLQGHIFTSWAVRAPSGRPLLFAIMGEFGQLWGERDRLHFLPVGFSEPATVEFGNWGGGRTIQSEIAHFVDAIEHGYEPLHSVAEATDTLRVILAAYEAADGGRIVSFGE